MITFLIPRVRVPEHRYIIDVMVGEFLGLSYSIQEHGEKWVEIQFKGSEHSSIILDDSFLTMPDELWLSDKSLPKLPVELWDTRTAPLTIEPSILSLPVIFGHTHTAHWIEVNEQRRWVGLDLLGSSFFFLTRYEELVRQGRDQHGRFPAAATVAVQGGFEQFPIVNAYTEILWSVLRTVWPTLRRKERQHRVLVSHDVDWPLVSHNVKMKAVTKSAIGDVIVRKAPITGARRIAASLASSAISKKIDPGNTFDFIMRESERRSLASAFYFIPENTAGPIDGTHSLDQPFVRSLLRDIHKRGHEIGLHPGYETYRNPERIASGAQRLQNACEDEGIQQDSWGGRQHYLRWEAPTTWEYWNAAGLNYDSTVGFAETVGFRSGTCYEHPVFDVLNRRQLTLRERPLIVMEMSLFRRTSRSYLAKPDDEGLEVLVSLDATVRQYRGDMTLLWHNSSLITTAQRSLYCQALNILAS